MIESFLRHTLPFLWDHLDALMNAWLLVANMFGAAAAGAWVFTRANARLP